MPPHDVSISSLPIYMSLMPHDDGLVELLVILAVR